jgi:hypothetical protein
MGEHCGKSDSGALTSFHKFGCGGETPLIMLISTALDSIIRNSVCTPAKLQCRRVEVGHDIIITGVCSKHNERSAEWLNGTRVIKRLIKRV